MNSKAIIWISLFVGSILGSLIPLIWGAGPFSFSSILFSALGGILGIWFGYKISH